MTDLFLIAHKVRGEPAFDVAVQMECPLCLEAYEVTGSMGCHECDELGYWWIIPTSGHRAYPWWTWELEATELSGGDGKNLIEMAGDMPPDLPDHYPTRHAPSSPRLDISALLAPVPAGRIHRRF